MINRGSTNRLLSYSFPIFKRKRDKWIGNGIRIRDDWWGRCLRKDKFGPVFDSQSTNNYFLKRRLAVHWILVFPFLFSTARLLFSFLLMGRGTRKRLLRYHLWPEGNKKEEENGSRGGREKSTGGTLRRRDTNRLSNLLSGTGFLSNRCHFSLSNCLVAAIKETVPLLLRDRSFS